MKIILLLLVCMAMSAGAIRDLNRPAGSPPSQEDIQYLGWRWPWPWFPRPYYPVPPNYPPPPPPVHHSPTSPPPPVHHSPSSPPPPVHHSPSPPPMFSPPPPPVHHSPSPPPPVSPPAAPKQFSPPPPVETKPPPSPSAPQQQPSGEYNNDPAQCETALATIDNCVGELITYYFGNSNSVGQSCCNRIKQLSQPCFGRAFMDEPSYYNKLITLCS